MNPNVKYFEVIGKFKCLGADCPDTCCHGWDMPSDARQRDTYAAHAPELLASINPDTHTLNRNPATQCCVHLCEGICTIHKNHGTEFLSDACHFYPRILHRLGERYFMTGVLSCPEMARLLMTDRNPFVLASTDLTRLPHQRVDRLPEGMSADEIEQQVIHAMRLAADSTRSPEQAMEALLGHAMALAGERYLGPSEARPGDGHAVYYALALTEAKGPPNISKGLKPVMQAMENALDCAFDRDSCQLRLGPNASRAHGVLVRRWKADAAQALAPALRRWLQAQVALTLYPFGGFCGASIMESAAVLVQRFATLRLALMAQVAENGVPPDETAVLQVIQALARFQDHLADMELTRLIHRDSGWQSVARLKGLIALHG